MSNPTRIESGSATRLEGGEASGSSPTRIESGAPAPSATPGVLPAAIAAKYSLVRPFNTLGAEADLYLVRNLGTGTEYVLKVYRRGLKPKQEVVEALQACDKAHVIELIEYGESDELWYEVLEFSEHGTLREWMTKGGIGEQTLLRILEQLFFAIQHLHQKQIIHRDLKPENVLIRRKRPVDLVLADFGIASRSDATQHFTTRSRTIKYGAPEAAAGSVGTSSDYWSLGLIILECATGRHPFDGLSDLAIALQLATARIEVSTVSDARLRILCQGLLLRDPRKRWGGDQVTKWLAGETPPMAADELERPSQKPYKFSKRECWTGADLAIELARNWKEGERHLARGLILPWLREELRDQDAANLLIDLTEERSLKTDDRLVRLIAELGKGLPPVWRGISLDAETLASLCRDYITGNALESDAICDLFDRGVFEVWARAGHEECGSWQQIWEQALEDYPRFWKMVGDAGGPRKDEPSRELIVHATLLAIVSPGYCQLLAAEEEPKREALNRCHWMGPLLANDGIAARLVRRQFLEEADREGRDEIAAAEELRLGLEKLRREFSSAIDGNASLSAELRKVAGAIPKNLAHEALDDSFPALRAAAFEASRRSLVGESFHQRRKKVLLGILADGAIVSMLFVVARYLWGSLSTADGLGYVTGEVVSDLWQGPSLYTLVFLVAAICVCVWMILRTTSRWWGSRIFGK